MTDKPPPIPFNRELDFEYGRVDQVSPLLRRVIAPNSGPFSFYGTGTYIIGAGKVAVVDPGPLIDSHIDAIKRAVDGEEVTHILVTHTHIDHSPAAAPLKAWCGAPTYGYGPHGAGKIEQGFVVEAGGDKDFVPDRVVRDGDVIEGDGWSVECVYTPGHTSNHVCFALREEKALLPGDHVMGWSTTIVSPPDGDMKDYMASLARLLERDDTIYWPTHGAPIEAPQDYVRALIAHREARERQILACLDGGLSRIEDMVPRMYSGYVEPAMYPAAARSVLAHLVWLVEKGVVRADGPLGVEVGFQRA
jgi:glyoxylase-like metal-dependent hydrolase (beta-lactamase superfamily II)